MSFILEILDFFKNRENKINQILKKEFDKRMLIFSIAYGISIWSQLAKASNSGKTLELTQLFMGLILGGAVMGLILVFVFPYLLSFVSKYFTKFSNFKDIQKVFAWCLAPFVIGSLLIIIELLVVGKSAYSGDVINSGFLSRFESFIAYFNSFISIYFVSILTKSLSKLWKIHWSKALLILFITGLILVLSLFIFKI